MRAQQATVSPGWSAARVKRPLETVKSYELSRLSEIFIRAEAVVMGERVSFKSNASTTPGYLAKPSKPGPGVVVIQEWWGLVPHIEQIADRFAAEGFLGLAPDLYHG